MKRIAALLLACLAAPALAQGQSGNIEQVDTPQGTVTIVRPTPRPPPAPPAPAAQPAPPAPVAAPPPAYSGGGYPVLVDPRPSVVIIQRRRTPPLQTQDPRRFDDVGPVPPLVPYEPRRVQPAAPLQSQGGFGRPLPAPRYSPNQYGPGAVPGTVPLPDAAGTIVILPR